MVTNAEVTLWQAVIKQAYHDTFSKSAQRRDRDNAIKWFCETSSDGSFQMVCDFADVEPQTVRQHFLKKLFRQRKGAFE